MLQLKKGNRVELAVDQIYVNPDQPRKIFEEEELEELSSSIREFGVIQPLLVTKGVDGKYLLIAGERRLRASKMAGLLKVPVVIREADEREVALISIIENVQRENLSYMEEALAYRRLTEEFGLTQAEIARKVGKKQSTISNKIRLLMLPEEDQLMLAEYGLTERHARAFLRIEENDVRKTLIRKVGEHGLNVKQTEKLIEEYLLGKEEQKRKKDRLSFINYKIYINSLRHTYNSIAEVETNAAFSQKDCGDYVEVCIKIPKTRKKIS
ncbi:MAG: ParB/RepB/Spo0J family partition protein [Firmicutes bacterium]|nr:ParB/RepB/Spo0J family partition protein [Bacillota bacterium]